MITLSLVQGSPEWLKARSEHFTASEAAAMMGVSRYQSRNELLKQKATGITEDVMPAQQAIFDRGHAAEALARPIAEEIVGEELWPVTGKSIQHHDLLASFDGITILGDVCWEHKLINKELRSVNTETLPELYKIQMDQQLLVSGATKCLFMASNGSKEDCNWFWYESSDERQQALLAGWEQFKADLQALKEGAPKETQPQLAGEKIQELPALFVDIVGEVRNTNLMTVKDVILARIDSVNTDLQTDQDFANAEEAVKFFTKAEKQLEQVKEQALAKTASIDELFKTVDHLKDAMRTKRLSLDKSVKSRKEQIRTEIILNARKSLNRHIESLERSIEDAAGTAFTFPDVACDFAGAIKGKKTISSLHSAADDELASAKVSATQMGDAILKNVRSFQELSEGFAFLFPDLRQLITYPADHMSAEVRSRISSHKEREQLKQQEEERIRKEKQAKAQAAKKDEAESPVTTAVESIEATPVPRFSPPAETITISVVEYKLLKQDSLTLRALEAAGVESWDGYDSAMKQIEEAT